MKVLYITLVILLASCINGTDTANDSTDTTSDETALLSGTTELVYSVPTDGIPFTIDSISVIFYRGQSITPFQSPAPALNTEFLEYTTPLNIGDTVTVSAAVYRNDTLIADALDSIIITELTLSYTGAVLNHLPIVSAGADRSVYVNNKVVFNTADVVEIDDTELNLWWKSASDSVFSLSFLDKYYTTASTDTIILKAVDGYGHAVYDTLLVIINDYDIGDLSSSSAVPTDVVSSSTTLSSSSVMSSSATISSSVQVLSSSLVSSSTVMSSSEAVVVSSSVAVVSSSSTVVNSSSVGPVLYELTVDGGTGSGFYEAGTVVDIVANANDTGMCFYEWLGHEVADETISTTTLVMPASNIIILNELFNCWELTILYNDSQYTDTTVTLSWGVEYYVYWEPPMDPRLGWTCIADWSHPHNGESESVYSPNLNTDSLFIQTPLLSSTYHHGKDTITKVGESCK
ncbi:MAG: hypothetical protein OCC49_12795 [Fibrobacterales bacterium]